jgi:hypothetical protein
MFLPMSLDELSKLWTGFAMQLRLSAAYEVSVALVDSTQHARTPLPVLTRGKDDQGNRSAANLTPPYPAIEGIDFPLKRTNALLNDQLVLNGHDLNGTNVVAVFHHRWLENPISIPIPAGPDATANKVRVTIPNDPVNWPAGSYTVQITVQRAGDSFPSFSNDFPFSLAPGFTIAPLKAPAGDIAYTVTCSPEVRPKQRASLLLGSREILADDHHLAQTNTLTFQALGVTAGDYFVRLRVGGVDSLLVNKAVKPPAYDHAQKVSVT